MPAVDFFRDKAVVMPALEDVRRTLGEEPPEADGVQPPFCDFTERSL